MPTTVQQQLVDYKGAEASTNFFAPIFLDQDLMAQFTMMGNVRSQKKMYFFNKLEKILKQKIGCGFTATGQISSYDRVIETFPMKAGLEQCFDEFEQTAMEILLKAGNDITDLQGTQVETIMLMLMRDALKLDIQRIAWWADKASLDSNYNQLDGYWKIFEGLVASGDVTRITTPIAGALAPGDGIDIFSQLVKAQSNELKGLDKNQKALYVSRELFEQYEDDIEALGGGDSGRVMLINGEEVSTYRGIPIFEQCRWDQIIVDDFGQNTVNRAVLTTPKNLVVATDLMAMPSELNISVYNDFLTEKLYTKTNMKLGADYVHNSLMVVAY